MKDIIARIRFWRSGLHLDFLTPGQLVVVLVFLVLVFTAVSYLLTGRFFFVTRGTLYNAQLTLPASFSATVGQEFSVPVSLTTAGGQTFGTDVVLKIANFDATKFVLTGVDPVATLSTTLRTFVPVDAAGGFDTAAVLAKANSTGVVEFGALTADLPSQIVTASYSGSTILAGLRFKALVAGTYNVNFEVTDSNVVVSGGNGPTETLSGVTNMVVTVSNPADTVAPTATITAPSAGQTVAGTVDVLTNATDNIGVAKVEFYVDGKVSGTDASSPYSFAWDSTTVNNGTHGLKVLAYDAAGNVGASAEVTVKVSNADSQPPTVTIVSPANDQAISGTVNIAAEATDNVGVTKVEFAIDGVLKGTATLPPYGLAWNSATVTNGTHSIAAAAFDAAGNKSADTVTVSVANADTTPPTVPVGLATLASAYNQVDLSWAAATDNVGVTGYYVSRNGVLIGTSTTTSYTDKTVLAAETYSYQVAAYDAAGNASAYCPAVSVTLPSATDTTPPTAPTNLQVIVVSSSQVNLSWTAATDNVGVAGYNIYRATGTGTVVKVNATLVATTSFGDTGLSASTGYAYYVKALDASGNVSGASNTVEVVTMAAVTNGILSGYVANTSGLGIGGVRVATTLSNGTKVATLTNSSGFYWMSLPSGTYRVKFSKTGYNLVTETVVVKTGQTTNLTITLIKKR